MKNTRAFAFLPLAALLLGAAVAGSSRASTPGESANPTGAPQLAQTGPPPAEPAPPPTQPAPPPGQPGQPVPPPGQPAPPPGEPAQPAPPPAQPAPPPGQPGQPVPPPGQPAPPPGQPAQPAKPAPPAGQPGQPPGQQAPPPGQSEQSPSAPAPPSRAPNRPSQRRRSGASQTATQRPEAGKAIPPISAPDEDAGALKLGGRVITAETARWTQEGVRLINRRHYWEAVDAFKRATGAASQHPVVWNNLGTAYMTVDQPLQAQRAFRRAIKLDPNYALAHYNLGAIRDAALDYDGAILSYARALELDPSLADPAKNPPVINNSHLAAVRTVLYGRQSGARGAPVTPVEGTPIRKEDSSAR